MAGYKDQYALQGRYLDPLYFPLYHAFLDPCHGMVELFQELPCRWCSRFFTAITGIQTPNWFAYGPFPIVVVLGLHYAPFAYILIGGILRNMDANLEEAALILKASRGKIMRKITIPIVLPAMLSTFLLVFPVP